MPTQKLISANDLKTLTTNILLSLRVPEAKAELVAESLVAANLRGVDSHGVLLLPAYIQQLRAGNIDPNADGQVASESGACMLFDGQNAFGQWVADSCCRHAARVAGQSGLSLVIARRSTHFGAAAFWAQRISAKGLIGLAMTNASPSVAPWQGRDGRIGTNPICVSLPSKGEGGWLLDMATTTVAKNRIVKAATNREPSIPAGWAMDADGEATTDTQTALKGLLMPLGGYKGSGLGLMVEILCGVLSGGALASQVGGLYILDRPMGTSHFFMAIDAGRFMPLEHFQERMEHLIRDIKSSRAAAGYGEVLVAGDPEWRMEAQRLRDGIPLDEGSWNRLANLAADLGVATS